MTQEVVVVVHGKAGMGKGVVVEAIAELLISHGWKVSPVFTEPQALRISATKVAGEVAERSKAPHC